MPKDEVKLKPNDEQRHTLDYLKQLAGLDGVHGSDQKTIYWALDAFKMVSLLFSIDKLLKFKGLVSHEYKQFTSKKYANVSQNARKSDTKTTTKVPLTSELE